MAGKSASHSHSASRGRLSSVDMLPGRCASDVRWARKQLFDRKIPQTLILQELNWSLEAKGVKRISKGAFSRWSVAQVKQAESIKGRQGHVIIDEAAGFLDLEGAKRLYARDRSDNGTATAAPISGILNRVRAAARIIIRGTL